jgi:hypothetical protein
MSTTKEFPAGPFSFSRLKIKMGANYKALKGVHAAIALTGGDEGYVVEGDSDTDLLAIGRFNETVDNTGGAAAAKSVEVDLGREVKGFRWLNDTGSPVAITDVGHPVYYKDNNTVTSDSAGTSIAGTFWGFDDLGLCMVEPASPFIEAAVAGSNASSVAITDTASLFASTDAEGALAELGFNMAQVNIPLLSAIDVATGALLAVFANGAVTTPGTQLIDSKSAGIRWNNHATPGAIAVNVAYPQDLDEASTVEFHALVSKSGATVGDATKLTVGAFEHIPGALHDADSDFGGDTGAIVGNATAKTVTEVSLVLAAANVHAPPASVCLTIKPKDGTLGTDDLFLHSAWLEIKRKNIAA